jgi:hypothetical protein
MSADLKGALITPKPAIAKLAEKSRSVYVSLAVLRRRAEFDIG